MDIMIMVASYPPTINSAARLYSELSESLRDMGHNVTVITTQPGEDSKVDKEHEYYKSGSPKKNNGLNILRVSPLSFLSKIPGGKPLRFFFPVFYLHSEVCLRSVQM